MKIAGLLIVWLSVAAQVPMAVAAQPTGAANAEFAASSKQAQQRYAADRLLCNDERDAKTRLQCRRDARDEYDRAMAEARAKMAVPAMPASGVPAAAVPAVPVAAMPPAPVVASSPKPSCVDCGRVTSISTLEKAGEGSAVGVIAGGATGALLGRQIGSGAGKDIATVAGALGGALAGKKIEEKVKTHKVWVVSVQYPDGSTRNFEFDQDPGYKVNDRVKNAGQGITRE
jgi:outer membrane lipoprotein SlyB